MAVHSSVKKSQDKTFGHAIEHLQACRRAAAPPPPRCVAAALVYRYRRCRLLTHPLTSLSLAVEALQSSKPGEQGKQAHQQAPASMRPHQLRRTAVLTALTRLPPQPHAPPACGGMPPCAPASAPFLVAIVNGFASDAALKAARAAAAWDGAHLGRAGRRRLGRGCCRARCRCGAGARACSTAAAGGLVNM